MEQFNFYNFYHEVFAEESTSVAPNRVENELGRYPISPYSYHKRYFY